MADEHQNLGNELDMLRAEAAGILFAMVNDGPDVPLTKRPETFARARQIFDAYYAKVKEWEAAHPATRAA